MYVIQHAHLMPHGAGPSHPTTPGEQHFCAIGPACGVHDFQVWMHTLPPGAHTPLQRHAGSFAVLVLAGGGKLVVDGGPLRFQSPCTLVLPPGADFQIANNTAVPLRIVSVFTDSPHAAPAGHSPG